MAIPMAWQRREKGGGVRSGFVYEFCCFGRWGAGVLRAFQPVFYMNLSSISPVTDSNTLSGQMLGRQRRQDLRTLDSALQLGDLAAAQKIFTAFKEDRKFVSQLARTRLTPEEESSVMKDFEVLGKALKSGNLEEARGVFAQVQQQVQSIRSRERDPGDTPEAAVPEEESASGEESQADEEKKPAGTFGSSGLRKGSGGQVGTLFNAKA